MARGMMAFLCETQARLGLVNTPLERGVFGFARGTKAILRSPRRATAAFLLSVMFSGLALQAQDPAWAASYVAYPTQAAQDAAAAGVGQFAPTGTPVKDVAAFNQRAQQFLSKSVSDRLRDLWKQTNDTATWLTDVVQTYRTIKMAKAQYDALASLNLMGNIQIVDFLPEMQLQPGYFFGSPADGFSNATTADGGSKQTYLALRFRERQGGAAAVFQNWPKFQPNLSINPQQLAQQLANLDFDAVQLVQYKDTQGNPIGKAIEAGNPAEASSRIAAYWDNLLQQANDWVTYQSTVQSLMDSQQIQMALNQQAYLQRVQDLQNKINQADQAGRTVLGIPVTTGTKSNWDAHYAPRVQLGALIMQGQEQINQTTIKQLSQKLQDIKQSNEVSQSSVTYFREAGAIQAQTQKILQTQLDTWNEILDRYKIARTDPGEKISNSVVGTIGLMSTDLANMKIPPQAEAELTRLMTRTVAAMQMQQMRLEALKENTRRVEAMDKAGNEVFQAQQKLITDARAATDSALDSAAMQAEAAVNDLQTFLDGQAAIRRADDAAAVKNLMNQLNQANSQFFTTFGNRFSAMEMFTTIANTYKGFLGAFFGHRSLGDVMGNQTGNLASTNLAQEWAMYEQCATGVQL